MVKLLCLNTNGIQSDAKKRRGMFRWLKQYHKANDKVVLLQETHSTLNDETRWKFEWQSKSNCNMFFSHGQSNSKGVLTILPPHYKVYKELSDNNGRILILCVDVDGDKICIVNVYAPSSNNVQEKNDFVKSLNDMMLEIEDESIICGGDYNVCMNPSLDKYQGSGDPSEYANNIQNLCVNFNLIDIWRCLNPEIKRFTWRQNNPLRQSRLDYWFVSVNLLYNVIDCDIKPSFRSDHSMLILNFENGAANQRGSGFWKFNSNLLKDEDYISIVKSIIEEYRNEYDYVENKGLKWDLIKMEIRKFTIDYSKTQASLKRDYAKEIQTELVKLDTQLCESPSEEAIVKYEKLKSDFNAIELEKTNGSILRSKANWTEYGERNTKFFHNLEKRNHNVKNISKLITADNTELTNEKEILQYEKDFYQHLYSTTCTEIQADNIFFNNSSIPQLSKEEVQCCDEQITIEQCSKALKDLPNDKSPGSDGFNTNFYKFFWSSINDLVLDSFRYAFQCGHLSIEQRRGILTLIPKKDKDIRFLKHWRPISLLNTDYKILTKTLSTRLLSVLPSIINPDQVAYVKDRYIGQNIRLMNDIITFTEDTNEPGIITCIDFEKAFDTVEWNFLFKTLDIFGFGYNFKRWISILYTDITAGVINNGKCTEFFNITRGIRQGCPISAYLFVMSAELLAIQIRENSNIEGINLNGYCIKIMQMADDTTVFVKDFVSLHRVLVILYLFFKVSGLKINKSKTDSMLLGSNKRYKCKPYGINWKEDYIYSLGVFYCHNEHQMLEKNFNSKLKSFEKTIFMWSGRDLSLKGKICVLKSMALPKLLYIAGNLAVPEWFVKKVNDLMFKFLWNNGPDKVKRTTIISDIDNGGLKMIHFESMVKSQKVMWVKRLCNSDHGSWKVIPSLLIHNMSIIDFLKCSYDPAYMPYELPTFYHQIFFAWKSLDNKSVESAWSIRRQFLLFNKYVKVNGLYLDNRYIQWYNAGIKMIHDIVDETGTFKSKELLEKEYKIKVDVMMLNSVMSALPRQWKMKLKECKIVSSAISNEEPLHVNLFEKEKPVCLLKNKPVYSTFIKEIVTPPTSIIAWENEFDSYNFLWKDIFRLPYITTRETKLQSFQFKILHRIYPCNAWVSKWKTSVNINCEFCNEVDSLQHFFIECKLCRSFWLNLENWWNEKSGADCRLQITDIIFGILKDNMDEVNLMILKGKYFIAKQKFLKKNILLTTFMNTLKYDLNIEKYICDKNNKLDLFTKRYGKLYNILC